MRILEDLRFFIGFFFLIVGGLLTFDGAVNGVLIEGYNINLVTGLSFLVFSLITLGLAVRSLKHTART